jgi:hypothetical protein
MLQKQVAGQFRFKLLLKGSQAESSRLWRVHCEIPRLPFDFSDRFEFYYLPLAFDQRGHDLVIDIAALAAFGRFRHF